MARRVDFVPSSLPNLSPSKDVKAVSITRDETTESRPEQTEANDTAIAHGLQSELPAGVDELPPSDSDSDVEDPGREPDGIAASTLTIGSHKWISSAVNVDRPVQHPKIEEAQAHVEGFLGYSFIDRNWLEEALWGVRATMHNGKKLPDGNNRLAAIGDAAITLVMTNQSYARGMSRGINRRSHPSR